MEVCKTVRRLRACTTSTPAGVRLRGTSFNSLLIFLVACYLGFLPCMAAQYTTGLISGSTQDIMHSPLPGAVVILESLETAERRTFTAGSDGLYSFASVPPGRYRLSVQLTGFVPQQVEVEVLAGQTVLRAIQLQLASASTNNLRASQRHRRS